MVGVELVHLAVVAPLAVDLEVVPGGGLDPVPEQRKCRLFKS